MLSLSCIPHGVVLFPLNISFPFLSSFSHFTVIQRKYLDTEIKLCILFYSAVRFVCQVENKIPIFVPLLRKYLLCWPMISERCITFLFKALALCANCMRTSPPFSKVLKKEDKDSSSSSKAIGGGRGSAQGGHSGSWPAAAPITTPAWLCWLWCSLPQTSLTIALRLICVDLRD